MPPVVSWAGYLHMSADATQAAVAALIQALQAADAASDEVLQLVLTIAAKNAVRGTEEERGVRVSCACDF